jgi:hypothetical protein
LHICHDVPGLNAERRFRDNLDDLATKDLDRDRPGMR